MRSLLKNENISADMVRKAATVCFPPDEIDGIIEKIQNEIKESEANDENKILSTKEAPICTRDEALQLALRKVNQYAIGDICLDGITPTSEFQEYADKERRGELTPEDQQKFIKKPYTTEKPSTAEVHALSERFLNKNKEAYESLASARKERPE